MLAASGHFRGEAIDICEQLRAGAATLYHHTAIVIPGRVTNTAQLKRE